VKYAVLLKLPQRYGCRICEEHVTAPILSFRDLQVWQLGMDLVVNVYRATEQFPTTERYGLTSQIRRAVVSIPSNIAEGHGRRTDGAYLNHIRIALGSQAELGTEIEAAARLGYLETDSASSLLSEIARVRQLLHGLRRSLERRRQTAIASATPGILFSIAAMLS
jgi:four helix bundle protein